MSYRGFGLENVGPGGPKKHFSEMTQEEQAEEGAKQMIEFMMAYDVPIGGNQAGHISDLPFKQQVKLQFADMGKRAWSSAKNFGYIGMIYAGVECGVESVS
ncbi:unnamed protein product [Wickerhamomyces anomalus]